MKLPFKTSNQAKKDIIIKTLQVKEKNRGNHLIINPLYIDMVGVNWRESKSSYLHKEWNNKENSVGWTKTMVVHYIHYLSMLPTINFRLLTLFWPFYDTPHPEIVITSVS